MQFGLAAIDRVFYQSEQLEISSAVARTEHYPVHHHPAQFQLEVVLRGATVCGIGQQRFLIPQHCYSIVNPDVEHYNVTQRWKHALFVIFPRHMLDETAWQIYRLWCRPVVFSEVMAPCSPALTALVHVLFHEASQPELPGRALLFDSALIQLSVLLLRSLRGNHTAWAIASDTPGPVRAQIARAVDLMHSCYQNELSLDDLARAAAMSRYHFLRSFKAHIGITPYAYLQQVRLRTAASLLPVAERSITEIALACGFTSSSRFSAAFRRFYQCSPSAYRRRHTP
jgi:AraC-like DNA-binding protein